VKTAKSKKFQGTKILYGEIEEKIFVKLSGNQSQEEIDIMEEYFKDKFDREVVFLLGNMTLMEVERM